MPVEDCKPYGEESTVSRSIDYRTAHLIRSAQDIVIGNVRNVFD